MPEATSGTRLGIAPTHLPQGATLVSRHATICGGELISAEAFYGVPADLAVPVWGGPLQVFRFRGGAAFRATIPADRLTEGTILGRPAAIQMPLTDDGFGPSAIIVRDETGLTVIRADGLRLDELKRVAEGLYR